MESDLFQNRHSESVHFPVGGMETVVATVSGYHGSERFNLIKLISLTGASYVGNMNRSTTHLVCWKFEGKKYELAKKLYITIVNHQWFEECAKEGRRVSPVPYSFQSGEDAGSLSLDIVLGINLAKAQSQALKNIIKPVVDIDSDDIDNAAWIDPIPFDEELFSQPAHGPNRSTRKAFGASSIKVHHGSSSTRFSKALSSATTMVLNEASTSLPTNSCRQKKKKCRSPEHQRNRRKLVKKHTGMVVCEEVKALPCNNSRIILSDNTNPKKQCPSKREAYSTKHFLCVQDNTNVRDDAEEFVALTDNTQSAQSSRKTSQEIGRAARENINDIGQPASSELSCVICWTDFSSTRGVLPCGHRFCFSCIQNWADHMASRNKSSTCPLCKSGFICISKVEDAVFSDQKIYSQSIPAESSRMDLYVLPDESHGPLHNPSSAVCYQCSSREPEDLLIKCNLCQIRCVHSYCLDPPLFPWTCVHCKDLQMLYFHTR